MGMVRTRPELWQMDFSIFSSIAEPSFRSILGSLTDLFLNWSKWSTCVQSVSWLRMEWIGLWWRYFLLSIFLCSPRIAAGEFNMGCEDLVRFILMGGVQWGENAEFRAPSGFPVRSCIFFSNFLHWARNLKIGGIFSVVFNGPHIFCHVTVKECERKISIEPKMLKYRRNWMAISYEESVQKGCLRKMSLTFLLIFLRFFCSHISRRFRLLPCAQAIGDAIDVGKWKMSNLMIL